MKLYLSSISNNLGDKGQDVFEKLMENAEYDLPESCDNENEEDANKVLEAAKQFRSDFADFVAIASFNDIASTTAMSDWIDEFADKYELDKDDEQTELDEAKMFAYVEKNINKQEFCQDLIVSDTDTIDKVKARLYEKALLATIATEHYSESQIILRDYYSLFPYNTANYGKLTNDQQIAVFTSFAKNLYSTGANAATKFDTLVSAKLKSGNGGSGSGSGSGSGNPSTGFAGGGVVANVTSPSSNKFTDIENVEWAKEAIEYLTEYGIISGRGNGVFAPNDDITRAEFVKIIVQALQITGSPTEEFADVAPDAWYADYVNAAKAAGIVSGNFENEFKPDSNITREDITVILYRAYNIEGVEDELSFADANSVSDYAKTAVSYFSKSGIINGVGDNMFAPKSNATRAQAAKMIYETIKRYGNK